MPKYQLEKFLNQNPDKPAKEPALTIGAYTGGAAGLLGLVTTLFPNLLTDRQTTIILVVVAFLLPLITAALTRGKVWSPATVAELVDEALEGAQEALHQKNKPQV